MDLQGLVDIHEISRLKYRYLRALDQKLWDELEGCFTEDATASYSGGAYGFEGRAAIMGFLREAMGSTSMLTSHKCHHPEIELTGRDSATGVWALDDVVLHLDYDLTIRGAAFYHDRYVKRGGQWLIAHTGYERVYEEMQPRASDIKLTAPHRSEPQPPEAAAEERPRFSREEIEAALASWQEAAAAGDWSAWAGHFTEDATYVEHHYGTFEGREAIRTWITETMSTFPGNQMPYFPLDWYVVDEANSRVVAYVQNRMVDPGDGSIFQAPNVSILHYAGGGLWSYEEDIYNPADFTPMIAAWQQRVDELRR